MPGSGIGGCIWLCNTPSAFDSRSAVGTQHSAVGASFADSYMYRVVLLRRRRLGDVMSAAMLTQVDVQVASGVGQLVAIAVGRKLEQMEDEGGAPVGENSGLDQLHVCWKLPGNPNPFSLFGSNRYGYGFVC